MQPLFLNTQQVHYLIRCCPFSLYNLHASFGDLSTLSIRCVLRSILFRFLPLSVTESMVYAALVVFDCLYGSVVHFHFKELAFVIRFASKYPPQQCFKTLILDDYQVYKFLGFHRCDFEKLNCHHVYLWCIIPSTCRQFCPLPTLQLITCDSVSLHRVARSISI